MHTKKIFSLVLFFILMIISNCKPKQEVKKYPDFGEMVLISAGEFIFGANEIGSLSPFLSPQVESEDAKPSRKIYLKEFYMDKYEVTYDQFLRFNPELAYRGGLYGHPVTGISWFQAEAFCRFAQKRLPLEEEWEKAARGAQGLRFPWGNEFDPKNLNVTKTILPAGSFKNDLSSYGTIDMAGNVSEWTASWYKPYKGSEYKSENFGEKYKVVRGGSFSNTEHNFLEAFYQNTFRHPVPPEKAAMDLGFRCVR